MSNIESILVLFLIKLKHTVHYEMNFNNYYSIEYSVKFISRVYLYD